MRFNPPPGWPEPPEGWKPEPGWTPDPTWPPAPPGWQLWIPETEGDATPGQPASPPLTPEEQPEIRHPAKQFWLGIVLILIGGGSLYASSGPQGGLILTGLLLWGALLVGKAIIGYFRNRHNGGPRLAPRTIAIAVVAMVAGVSVVGVGATRTIETMMLTETVGSCWKIEDSQNELYLVRCGGAHDYVAVASERTIDDCPLTSFLAVDRTGGGVLCLDPAS